MRWFANGSILHLILNQSAFSHRPTANAFLLHHWLNQDLPFHGTSSTIDLYADDTTLTSCANYSSIERLEQNLNSSVAEIAEWTAFNKLPINESKTKAILITGKCLPSNINYEMALTINGTKLEVVLIVKLLGLEIDSELSFNSHVEELCTKLSQRIGILKNNNNLILKNACHASFNAFYEDRLKHKDKKSKKRKYIYKYGNQKANLKR